MMIIHISGAPGSGKTTLGIKLKAYYKSKIIVKDLDDLFAEYMKPNTIFNSKKYQKFIYDFIKNITKPITKPVIFVGLNSDPISKGSVLYDIKATHKFFIDLPIDINLQRHFIRELDGWLEWMKNRDHNILFDQLLENQKNVTRDLTNNFKQTLDINNQKKMILSFSQMYKENNYEFLTDKKIYNKILKLIKFK